MNIFGYFNAPAQTKAEFDPGLNVPCPICLVRLSKLEVRITTISLLVSGDIKSFFFRAHKSCWDEASAEDRERIEGSLVDARSTRKSEAMMRGAFIHFDAGARAHSKGIPRTANPYRDDTNTNKHLLWDSGWTEHAKITITQCVTRE